MSDNPEEKLLEYTDDYLTSYTDKSIVTKKYVDSMVGYELANKLKKRKETIKILLSKKILDNE